MNDDPLRCPKCEGSLRVKTTFYTQQYVFPFLTCRTCGLLLARIEPKDKKKYDEDKEL